MGKNGAYKVMTPDYENAKFAETEETVSVCDTVQYSMQCHLESKTHGYISHENIHLSKDEVHKKTFKELVENLNRKGEEFGVDYILLNITHDHDNGTAWKIGTEYQFLMKNKK